MVLFFLSGNGVMLYQPTNDDWYRTGKDPILAPFRGVDGKEYQLEHYLLKEPASPIACTDQYQFCRATTQGDIECPPLASLRDAFKAAAPLFDSHYSRMEQVDNFTSPLEARWIYFTMIFRLAPRFLVDVVATLGPTALRSQSTLIYGIQGPLEENQWQVDVSHWWDISNAGTQAAFVNAVYRPSSPDLLRGWVNFTKSMEGPCGNQVCCFRSLSLYHSFSCLLFPLLSASGRPPRSLHSKNRKIAFNC